MKSMQNIMMDMKVWQVPVLVLRRGKIHVIRIDREKKKDLESSLVEADNIVGL